MAEGLNLTTTRCDWCSGTGTIVPRNPVCPPYPCEKCDGTGEVSPKTVTLPLWVAKFIVDHGVDEPDFDWKEWYEAFGLLREAINDAQP